METFDSVKNVHFKSKYDNEKCLGKKKLLKYSFEGEKGSCRNRHVL